MTKLIGVISGFVMLGYVILVVVSSFGMVELTVDINAVAILFLFAMVIAKEWKK